MSILLPAYFVERLATGSYDVLLHGRVVASLVQDTCVNGVEEEWHVELLDELPPSERPAPFTAQSHTFCSRLAALEWLGLYDAEAMNRLRTVRRQNALKQQTKPRAWERYQLRLLSKHPRFYSMTSGFKSLVRRGLVAPTGWTDKTGRAEWTITDIGRAALTKVEP